MVGVSGERHHASTGVDTQLSRVSARVDAPDHSSLGRGDVDRLVGAAVLVDGIGNGT